MDATVDTPPARSRTASAVRSRAWRDAHRPTAPPDFGYDALGRWRSRKPALRVSYTLTPKAEAALDGWVGLTLAGYAALGGAG